MSESVPTLHELLTRLVAFNTTSEKSNLMLIDFVRDYLDSHGVTSTLTRSPDATKASLFASIGPQGEGVTATAFRSRSRAGPATRSRFSSAMASSTAAEPAT